jgi:8-amino-7-oxononanoate synthase
MLDFTSALYLGFRHATYSLRPWEALTLGRPAALRELPEANSVAAELARLQGCEAATLVPSTLHLFWDLFHGFGRDNVALLCDGGMYPIARWGAERAAARGVPLHTFPHHDTAALARLATHTRLARRRPIVVADGYCPGCGRAAPIRSYADVARRCDGFLVLDDTQALGVLGQSPTDTNPYGSGGGGSLRWHGTFGPQIVVGSSLAKGFGVPVAVLAASAEVVDRFRTRSETRVHSSPPSAAAIAAASHALTVNRTHGDALRGRLVHLVSRLRHWLSRAGGLMRSAGRFPVQSLCLATGGSAALALLYERLLQNGVRAVLTRACGSASVRLTFLLTARHEIADVDAAGRVLLRVSDASRGHLPDRLGVP